MWGVETFINGRGILTPDGAGGVFHSFVTFDGHDETVMQRFTFYDIPGSTIFVFATLSAGHNWSVGVDGSGYPYAQALGYPIPEWDTSPNPDNYKTTLGVFVK